MAARALPGPAGIARVRPEPPGPTKPSIPGEERSVFFQAFSRGFGLVDLWSTDGSPAGTTLLAGQLLMTGSGRSLWSASRGLLYFVADDLVHGAEIWRSDGTPGGTFQLADLAPGGRGSDPAELTEVDGRLFFRADDGERGPALWTSDGTAAGTRPVLELPPAAGRPCCAPWAATSSSSPRCRSVATPCGGATAPAPGLRP